MADAVHMREVAQEVQSEVSRMREQIPAAGLREYWYPAFPARWLRKRKPFGLRLLDEDIVFFRDLHGDIAALRDLCAHRGGKLSRGDCHFPGTLTCPYHGWTYDATGKCVATIAEGPQSHIPKTEVRIPLKKVQQLRGVVWVWMGNGQPVPLEEDVPEEFLDPDTMILTDVRIWPINWRPLIENAIDGHAPYVHRNSVVAVLLSELGPLGQKSSYIPTRDGRGIGQLRGDKSQPVQEYPGLGKFPKSYWRRYWVGMFQWLRKGRNFTGKPYSQEILLPGITRNSNANHLYIRWAVPIDEHSVRNFYWHIVRGSRIWKLWFALRYYLFRRWAQIINFSEQDRAVVELQDYTAKEKLSGPDAVVIQWRKLVLQGYHQERLRRTRVLAVQETDKARQAAE
jgi:phenylpropionate dioxygenase-like ring-hydroxylating dioxygenase large terminal subunit